MPVDSSIAMSGRPFQMADPLEMQSKVMSLGQLAGQQQLQQMQIQQAQRTQDQENTLADLYKGNVGPDGTVNRQGVLSGAAQRGLGAKIPGMQKQFADADKAVADVGHVGAQTGELEWKVNKGKLEASGAALSSLLANPNVTHDDVIQTTIDLVKRGIIPAEQGQQTIRSLPGDPVRLRQYLVQKGMEIMEAGKRMEMLAPKRQEVNDGKTTSFVDVNPYTNPQGPAPIKMQTTPGQDQSNATTVRGQNVSAGTAAQRLNFDKEQAAQAVTYQQNDDGSFVALPSKTVPGSTVKAQSVLAPGPGMQPLKGKSTLTEDQAKASGWLAQATNAWKNMQSAMGGVDPKTGGFKNPDVARPGVADALGNIPSFGIGEVVGNTFRSADRQKFMQASSSLSEAVLRAATGAGVNKDEAAQKAREITPVFGGDAATTKQKMEAIPVYLQSLQMRAGPGARKVGGVAAPDQLNDSAGLPPDIAAILKKHGGK